MTLKDDFENRLLDAINNDQSLTGCLEGLNSEMRRYHQEEFESIADVKKYAPDEYDRIVETAKERVGWIVNKVTFLKNGVQCWRSVTLGDPTLFIKRLQENKFGLGIYWTFERSKAKPYWGDKNKTEFVFHAAVPLDSIDYDATLKANTTLAFSNHESEITLISEEELVVIDVTSKGTVYPFNKVFTA